MKSFSCFLKILPFPPCQFRSEEKKKSRLYRNEEFQLFMTVWSGEEKKFKVIQKLEVSVVFERSHHVLALDKYFKQ